MLLKFANIIYNSEGEIMAISYNGLWKLLIDKNMKKMDLCRAAGNSTNALAKLGKKQYVNTAVLDKICCTLDCKIEDIMEVILTKNVYGEKN